MDIFDHRETYGVPISECSLPIYTRDIKVSIVLIIGELGIISKKGSNYKLRKNLNIIFKRNF